MKRILIFTVIGIAILSMLHSIESVYNLWQKRDIIIETKKQVQKEEEENTKLKQQLQKTTTTGFVEEEARNKLFMVKPGEQVVFIPSDALATPSGVSQAPVEQLSSWEQWLHLFFN